MLRSVCLLLQQQQAAVVWQVLNQQWGLQGLQ
jgi:hypothetical protein